MSHPAVSNRLQFRIRVLGLTAALLLHAALGRGAQDAAVSRMTFTKGWATFGLAVPAGAARSGLQVGTFPTQTDVKVRWPDGSIRFAVVSTKIL